MIQCKNVLVSKCESKSSLGIDKNESLFPYLNKNQSLFSSEEFKNKNVSSQIRNRYRYSSNCSLINVPIISSEYSACSFRSENGNPQLICSSQSSIISGQCLNNDIPTRSSVTTKHSAITSIPLCTGSNLYTKKDLNCKMLSNKKFKPCHSLNEKFS